MSMTTGSAHLRKLGKYYANPHYDRGAQAHSYTHEPFKMLSRTASYTQLYSTHQSRMKIEAILNPDDKTLTRTPHALDTTQFHHHEV